MFTFPKAASKSTWGGQGDVWGEGGMLPYLGGDSLGLCFGMSAIWLDNGSPSDAQTLIRSKKDQIVEVQTDLGGLASMNEKDMLDAGAASAGLTVTASVEYGQPASHVILDLLGSTAAADYIFSFYFTNGGARDSGHAIAITFSGANDGTIMDPNYGRATYTSRALLCDDLHKMLAAYVPGNHYVTKVILQTIDQFGAFQRA